MRVPRTQTDYIVWHCSATNPEQTVGADWIDGLHRRKGWNGIGYQLVIKRNGRLEPGEPLGNRGAHVKGFNHNSVGVCMIGGVNMEGKPETNFTDAQWETAFKVQAFLEALYPNAKTVGHRDLSPDIDGDGEVEEWEWLKQCPVFDAEETFKQGEPVFATSDIKAFEEASKAPEQELVEELEVALDLEEGDLELEDSEDEVGTED